MNAATGGDVRRFSAAWWLRPRIALPVLAALVVLVGVFTPEQRSGRSGDDRLTTHSAEAQGARGFYELAQRLGWRVERQTVRGMPPLGSDAIRAILAPPLPPTATETHAALEGVRRGGALLVVLGSDRAFGDSLGVRRSAGGMYHVPDDVVSEHDYVCEETSAGLPLWPDQRVRVFGLRWRAQAPPSYRVFAESRLESAGSDIAAAVVGPAAVGFPLGAGRVVVVSDPDLLRNDVLRLCDSDVDAVAVRMLEYLSERPGAAPRRHLVFDEYHQGFGAHPGSIRTIVRYLGTTGSGRTLLQIVAAGLILLLARAARPVPPPPEPPVERRSPLEHVEALATAYGRVAATRTVTRHLLHGVRRRAERRLRSGTLSDIDFLRAAAARDKRIATDAELVERALRAPVAPAELERTGAALDRIESSLMTTP